VPESVARGPWGTGLLLALCVGVLAPLPGAAEPAGRAALEPPEEGMERPDHPLVTGRLTGRAARERLAAFGEAWVAARRDGTGTEAVFDAFLDDLGTDRIAAWFEARQPSCHGELHNLGRVVAARVDDAITAMAVCSDACTYACIHGAVKGHYADRVAAGETDVAGVQADLVALCADRPVVADFYPGNCAHAAGHAFAIVADSVARAVALCEGFPDPEDHFYCETGLFMQVSDEVRRELDWKAGPDRARRRAARIDYCAVESRHVSACLRFVLADFRLPEDLDRLGEVCDALFGTGRLGCFNALGYLARPRVATRPEEINTLCGRGTRRDRELCVSGVVFAKKDHMYAERLDRACRALENAALARLCAAQRGTHYYRHGNPVLARMLN
jgi:hypothetical protein